MLVLTDKKREMKEELVDVTARVRDRVVVQVIEEVYRHASIDASDSAYAMIRERVFCDVSDHVYVQVYAQIGSNS
jgi:hypothetical protein